MTNIVTKARIILNPRKGRILTLADFQGFKNSF